MELDTSRQALSLLLFILLGALIGTVYDALTPLRRRSGALLASVCDMAFALSAGALIFVFAMRFSRDGRAGMWLLAAVVVGFLAYMNTFSRFIHKFFQILYELPNKLHNVTKKF